MRNELKERLNAKQICDRRDQIEALLTQAISLIGEADSLLKTVSTFVNSRLYVQETAGWSASPLSLARR